MDMHRDVNVRMHRRRTDALNVLMWIALCALVPLAQVTGQSEKTLKEYLTGLPFVMPEMKEPVFPDRRLSIAEFGAVADGRTVNTAAFAAAIESCASAGGGMVLVPPGTWVTGSIRLRDNVNLHVERGAVVQFSRRLEDFPLVAGYDGKSSKFQVTPPILGYRLKNIAITGEGVFDGGGEAWRPVKKEKQTPKQWKDLLASGGAVSDDGKIWWPSRAALEGEDYLKGLDRSKKATAEDYRKAGEFLRPNMVHLVQCDGILIDGPTFSNSPRFHVYPVQSENIIVRNCEIITPWYAQNGDGLDFNACRNVVVYNVTVDAGDDGICIKPGRIASKQSPGPACENIVIADCIVYHGHGGVVIGSESFGGARNISVKNCTFIGTDVGLRFKSTRGKGGLIERVFIDGIQMRNIGKEAVLFDMLYGDGEPEAQASQGGAGKSAEPVDQQTPQFRDFTITNVTCTGADRAILINGLREMPVRNIRMEGLRIAAAKGVLLIDADSVTISGSNIDVTTGPGITVDASRSIRFDRLLFSGVAGAYLRVVGPGVAAITVDGVDLSRLSTPIIFDAGATKDAVLVNGAPVQ